MQKPALTAPQVAGLLVGLLGTTLAVRWVFQVDAIARVIPGARYTGIVDPLLFMVAGLCLFNASPPQARRLARPPRRGGHRRPDRDAPGLLSA